MTAVAGRALAVVALAFATVCASAEDAHFLAPHDGPGGMTCDYYDQSLRIPWQGGAPGWIDARGIANGAAPFAAAPFDQGVERVEFDVTKALAADARRVPGTLLLRGVSARGGRQNFASREDPDERRRPRLTLVLGSGRALVLPAAADTVIDCTSNSSLGRNASFQVGPDRSAVIRFEVPADVSRQIRSAKLELHGVNNYGPGIASLYALAMPVDPALPAKERGLAASHPLDRGLEGSAGVLFAEQFESPDWARRWSVFDVRSRARQTDDNEGHGFRKLRGRALAVTIAKGASLGLDLRYRLAAATRDEPEEAYFRYYLRFGDDWGSDVDGGKLPGLSGTYGRAGWGGREPDGYNGWNMRMTFAVKPPPGHPGRELTAVGTEASLPPQRVAGAIANSSPRWAWTNGFLGVLERNRWYCIEQHVRLNTPGEANGLFEAWVDGELAIARHAVDYRYVPDLKIQEIWLNVYHGGTEPAATDQHLYIDNVVVARRYIGPMTQ
jgi:hypothetical protein